MTPLESYLREPRGIRTVAAGVPETSYYPASSNLLNEVGRKLKPRVRCMMKLPNFGPGNPDPDVFHQDWPRIPLPDSKELLLASASLGKQIAVLLDTETPSGAQGSLSRLAALEDELQGRQAGPALRKIAVFTWAGERPLDESRDLSLTAGWGHAGQGGVTMPGRGKIIEREYAPEERAAVAPLGACPDAGRERRPLHEERIGGHRPPLQQLGGRTLDVYLNDGAYWKNIPARLWEYTIGGYQVIEKWLSYCEQKLLGRRLTKEKEEVRYVQEMVQHIAAILLLEPALGANYHAVKGSAYSWPGQDGAVAAKPTAGSKNRRWSGAGRRNPAP